MRIKKKKFSIHKLFKAKLEQKANLVLELITSSDTYRTNIVIRVYANHEDVGTILDY